MQSPFDVGADSLGFSAIADGSGGSSFALQSPSSLAAPASPARRLLPLYRHTMLRLRTTSFEAVAAEAVAAAEQRRLRDLTMEAGGEQPRSYGGPVAGAGASSDGGGSCGGGASLEPPRSSGEAQQLGAAERQLDVRLAQRFYPMLTPSGCTRQLPITPQEATGIYTGAHRANSVQCGVSLLGKHELRTLGYTQCGGVQWGIGDIAWLGHFPHPCLLLREDPKHALLGPCNMGRR